MAKKSGKVAKDSKTLKKVTQKGEVNKTSKVAKGKLDKTKKIVPAALKTESSKKIKELKVAPNVKPAKLAKPIKDEKPPMEVKALKGNKNSKEAKPSKGSKAETVLKPAKGQKIEKPISSKEIEKSKSSKVKNIEKEEIVTPEPKPKTFKEALAQPLVAIEQPADAEQKEESDRISPEDLVKKPSKKYQADTDEESKWLELKDKYKTLKPQPYRMTDVFRDRTVLDHKVLGIGFILSVVNDRLEVLFQSGIKQLISNYKR